MVIHAEPCCENDASSGSVVVYLIDRPAPCSSGGGGAEFNGKPVGSVKKGFKTAVGLARLPGKFTPHTLRHTAATWLMQRGVPIREAAGFLGLSPAVLQDTHGHHHPDRLHGAAVAIGQKDRYVSVAETVADLTLDRNEKKNPNDFWSEWQDSNLRPLRPERSALPG